MRKVFCGAVLGLLVLLTLAASEALAQGDAKAGAQVYNEQKCARCHGDAGKGDGPTAEKLKGKIEILDWTNKAAMSKLTNDFLAEITSKGGKAVGKSAIMPSYGTKLENAQIQNLVAYIRSLAP
jgi:cytochrome c oxidase cbb3-type subunit 3